MNETKVVLFEGMRELFGIYETTNRKAEARIVVAAEDTRIVEVQASVPSVGTARRGTPPASQVASDVEASIVVPGAARQT